MKKIILIIFVIILLSFKSYNDSQNDEIKNFIVGELKDLELIEDKKNISNLFFQNNLNENIKFSKFNGNILLINFTFLQFLIIFLKSCIYLQILPLIFRMVFSRI